MTGEITDPVDPINESLILAMDAFTRARSELWEAVEAAKQADTAEGMEHLQRTGEMLSASDRVDMIRQAIGELVRDGLPYMPNRFPAQLPVPDED